jgi:esterase/lipase
MMLAIKVFKTTESQVQLKLLYDYLDDQFSVLHDNLYPEPFKKLLQSLWDSISSDLKDIILPEKQTSIDLDLSTSHYIVKILENLQEYFHADGAGLKREYLTEHTADIRQLLDLFQQSTQQLIKTFTTSAAKNDTEIDNELIKRVLQARVHEDKEAVAFLNEYDERDKVLDSKTDLQKVNNLICRFSLIRLDS